MEYVKLNMFLVSCLLMNKAMAQNYFCFNSQENVEVLVTFISATTAEVAVKVPFQKKMICDVNDFTNGKEVIKGLACDNGEEAPDVLAINENLMTGMIEVINQPHYNLICK